MEQGQPGERTVQPEQRRVVGQEPGPVQDTVLDRAVQRVGGLRVGVPDQLDPDPVRLEQAGGLDQLGAAACHGQPAEVDDPAGTGRRYLSRHRGLVRHHRVQPPEPGRVPVLGQQQVQAPLGRGLGGADRSPDDHAGSGRQPRLEPERGRSVLVHVPDHRRAPGHALDREQQFGIVDDGDVDLPLPPLEKPPSGANRREPAPPDRAR